MINKTDKLLDIVDNLRFDIEITILGMNDCQLNINEAISYIKSSLKTCQTELDKLK